MLNVQAATGLKHQLVSYIGPRGNASCSICGAVSTAAAPDFLRRERKGWIWDLALTLARKRHHRNEGGKTCMESAARQATKLVKLPDRIAAILAKSVAVQGDAFELDDAEALVMILDIINELDPTLIERNANKKLARQRMPS